MSKKKKKKKQKSQTPDYLANLLVAPVKTKKAMYKDFDGVMKEIECYRVQLAEADKKGRIKGRRKINKKTEEFYTDMESIRCRTKMAKNWEKTGFLDNLINILSQISPLVKLIAKLVCSLIVSFLSIKTVKEKIKPETVDKIGTVFDVAMKV